MSRHKREISVETKNVNAGAIIVRKEAEKNACSHMLTRVII